MYNVLIIEDEEDIRENTKEIFEIAGHNVNVASNGKEGLKMTMLLKPDLILCDIMMPVMDGFEVKKRLGENSRTSSIPFIFLTAKADVNSIREGMGLGSDDYIVKPVSAKTLIDIVSKRMQRIEDFKKQNEEVHSRTQRADDLDTAKQLSAEDKVPLYNGKELFFVTVNNIVAISIQEDYSAIHINDGRKIMMKKTIKSWEESLPPKVFIRAHRSLIINLNYVEKLEPWFNNTLIAKMKIFPGPVKLSKRYSSKIKKMLKDR